LHVTKNILTMFDRQDEVHYGLDGSQMNKPVAGSAGYKDVFRKYSTFNTINITASLRTIEQFTG